VRLSRGLVHYELSGPEGGSLVVLVPGLSVPYSTWDRNAPALASEGFRVLRYEHYGRGYSDRPRVAYSLDLYVEQLAELLQSLGLAGGAFLVGLSMGGPVAAATATRRPGLAVGLAFVDPLFEWPAQGPRARLLTAPLVGDAIMALRGPRILAEGQRVDFLDEASYLEFLPSYLPPLGYAGIGRAVLATLRSIPSWPLRETYAALGRTSLPLLLLWGKEDATLPFEQSRRLLRLMPAAEFRCVEDAGHVPQWEKAEEVNEALIKFIKRRPYPPKA
jgi:pimeloyl-ACP methyl ester carboxylesterase